MAEKIRRRELKTPDAFLQAGVQATTWLERNRGWVVSVLALVFVSGLVAALTHYSFQRRDEQAAKALGSSLAILQRPVEGEPAHFNPGMDAPFHSEAEKEATAKKALEEFRKRYGRTHAVALAALVEAPADFRTGDFDKALLNFEDYLKEAPSNDPLHWAAMEGQGYSYEAKGQLDLALATFEKMARQNKTDFLIGMGQYHQGRILALQNKKQDAAKVFAQVGSDHPATAAARMAADRLKDLEAQGVLPPPKQPPGAAPSAAASSPSNRDAGSR